MPLWWVNESRGKLIGMELIVARRKCVVFWNHCLRLKTCQFVLFWITKKSLFPTIIQGVCCFSSDTQYTPVNFSISEYTEKVRHSLCLFTETISCNEIRKTVNILVMHSLIPRSRCRLQTFHHSGSVSECTCCDRVWKRKFLTYVISPLQKLFRTPFPSSSWSIKVENKCYFSINQVRGKDRV